MLEEEFHSLLDDVVDGISDKLDISKAVKRRTSSDTAASLVSGSSTVHKEIIDPEIERYRKRLKRQFSLLIDTVESGEEVDEKAEDLLQHDIFYQNLESENREIREKILDRLETLQKRLDRINDSNREDVWGAVHDEFTRDEAEKFVEEMFGFLNELEEHRAELAYRKEVDLSKISSFLPFKVEVDYTPEAFEVMRESEKEVRDRMMKRIDNLYSDKDTIKL